MKAWLAQHPDKVSTGSRFSSQPSEALQSAARLQDQINEARAKSAYNNEKKVPPAPPPCEMTTLPKVGHHLHRTVFDANSKVVTRFAASPRTDISPQRKEARPRLTL
jgi:hypothetical protein